jgi:HPr kinase/phosphorylase
MAQFKHDTVTVGSFFEDHGEDLQLKLLTDTEGMKRIIREPTVNRPGLGLTGFTKYFAYKRMQVIGNAEAYYLKAQSPEQYRKCCASFFSFKIPCVVFSRNLHPDPAFIEAAHSAKVPVFQCPLVTMKFINLATLALESMFAPRGTEMGSMVDILGVGVIIKGESGIGKSESVLALLERGYSLVADDVTKVSLLDGKDVIGTSSEITRDHMEVRGIGIINVAAMFGVKSIRHEKRVDLVVTLKSWNEVSDVDRLGLEQEYVPVLGIDVPHITIPVRPGRDLARLIEVAAFQVKLKIAGHNPAKELNDRLIARMAAAAGRL